MFRVSLLAMGIACSTTSAARPDDKWLTTSPVVMPADLGSDTHLGPLRFRGGVELSTPTGEFWGYSGLWVSSDGKRMAGVNFGNWMTANLIYAANGDLVGVTAAKTGPLLDAAGKPFTDRTDQDAEALDFDGQRFFVGFEQHDRVLAYSAFDRRAAAIALPPAALANIPFNMGFSSVAILPGGALLALPEGTSDPGQPATRGWLIRGNEQGPVWVRPSDGLPVSLAAFPNGDLLLLELVGAKDGMATRLSRIKRTDVKIGAVMQTQDFALIAPPIVGSRIEGASIRNGPKGEMLIYLMASDKRSPLYMFELVE